MDINDIKYLIIDTECLQDYFSFQYRSEKMKETKIIQCTTDKHFKQFYKNVLCKITRPVYHYSIGYDDLIINSICKLVETKQTEINKKLRKINDYLIKHGIDYFKLNKEYWVDIFFKGEIDQEDYKEKCFDELKDNKTDEEIKFIDEFKFLFGKSQTFKSLNILSIPKIMYYYTVRNDNKLRMSVSLKKLQLYYESYNIKFDLSKYTSISQIKKDNLYDEFIKYSINDVDFLYSFFQGKPRNDIVKRLYAVKAVKKLKPDFTISLKAIYSENNTMLISEILKIPNPQKDFTLNYRKYIDTPYEKFNNFVEFTQNNQDEKRDLTLKKRYCEQQDKMITTDDKKIVEGNQVETICNSIDEVEINNVLVKIGYGGIHGAKKNYIKENLIHLDYESQYPSIILQYKDLFSKIMNVDFYEQIYIMRNREIKRDIKLTTEELVNLRLTINNDKVASLDQLKELRDKEDKLQNKLEELNKLKEGSKLILNMAYGIINSNFSLPISCKKLGRFVCLKGQSMLLNLAYKLKDSELANLNTDGIICKDTDSSIDIPEIVQNDRDGFFKLELTKIDKLIQKAVNTYIKISDGKLFTKGEYNLSIKNIINKHAKFMHIKNALRKIEKKPTDIHPIYINTKYLKVHNDKSDLSDSAYYLTDETHGNFIIKKTIKPNILNTDGEIIYVTSNKEDAKIEMYTKFAQLTYIQIMSHNLNMGKTIKYIEHKLEPDQDTENITLKRSIKTKLSKLYDKDKIQMIDKDGVVLTTGTKVNKKYNNYTMTDILKSSHVVKFAIKDTNLVFNISCETLKIIN